MKKMTVLTNSDYQHLSLVALQEGKLLLNPWNKDPGAVLDLATGTGNARLEEPLCNFTHLTPVSKLGI